jgi:allantoate deiminase
MNANLFRIKKDIEMLSKYNATPNNGLTRFTFTPEDRGAREYIKSEMKKSGLLVYEDAIGNLIGRLEGKMPDKPIIIIGSHFDSVKNGGNFDGNAGVVAALEIARVIKEKNIILDHPVEFIAMIEEEGGRFGSGLLGSRAMTWKISIGQLEKMNDIEGLSFVDAAKDFGIDIENLQNVIRKPEQTKAYLELHIEQGPVLEHENLNIGIVHTIVGIHQLEVTIFGRPDHSGTTPMDMRIDALQGTIEIIKKIDEFVKALGNGTVATIGVLEVSPGAANIVPGEVRFVVDIRSKDKSSIEKVAYYIKDKLEEVKNKKNIKYFLKDKLKAPPVELDSDIILLNKNNCENLGFTWMDMVSGAGHDAMVFKEITKVGLIFIPSKGGRSHCPEEWTEYSDIQKGTELIFQTLLDLAMADNP